MNSDSENVNLTSLEYLKLNYTIEDLLKNETIFNILDDNYKRHFTIYFRGIIEELKQKYINIYNADNIFKNDLNNCNWERLFDIIYNNTEKQYDLGMIYEDPEFFINILEKKN